MPPRRQLDPAPDEPAMVLPAVALPVAAHDLLSRHEAVIVVLEEADDADGNGCQDDDHDRDHQLPVRCSGGVVVLVVVHLVSFCCICE